MNAHTGTPTPVEALTTIADRRRARPYWSVGQLFEAAERHASGEPLPGTEGSLEHWAAVLRVAMRPENVERLRADAELAVKDLAPGSYFWSAAQYVLEIASLLAGKGASPGPTAVEAHERSDGEDLEAGALGFRVRRAASLTAAELRLLPFLATQLSYREIGERLFISRNTVKTEAISAYHKLCASSRSEAVEHAAELGLIEATAATDPGDRDTRPRTLVGILAGFGAGAMLSAISSDLFAEAEQADLPRSAQAGP